MPPILPPQDGYLFLDKAKFAASFAADVDPERVAYEIAVSDHGAPGDPPGTLPEKMPGDR